MTHPNAPHWRRYADPDTRPSRTNVDPVVAHTRQRIQELHDWLDAVNVVRGAERLCEEAAS